MGVVERLRLPYARLVLPDSDGAFFAQILEFPGCFATGSTAAEALAALEDVAASWVEAALELGQTIPEPVGISDFSGRLLLRLPKSLHRKAALVAEMEGVSLNQFIVAALAQSIGEKVP